MNLRRGALTDHYVEADRSVVMVDESVLGLSPVATAILEAVPDGAVVSLRDVTEHVVNAFGPPEGPESAEGLTRQQVWDLVAHNVLVIVDDEKPRDGTSSSLLDQQSSFDAVEALRDAIRHLRAGEGGRWPAPPSLSGRALVDAARRHHVVPYMDAHLDRLELPGQARSELEVMAGRQHAGASVLASDLSVALDALRDAGVRALAFKGVALAAQAYGDFRARGAGDLDLLVAPDDLERAHRVLGGAGWAPAPGWPTPGPSWAWRHFVRTGYELLLSGPQSDIDLHWHLVPTRGTFPDFDALWERHQEVSVDGHPTPTLSPYDALAHSAAHAAKDRWRWIRSLLDVHLLASRRDTWLGADRPLRGDELATLGLSVIAFGQTSAMPHVVEDAARSVSDHLVDQVRREQAVTAPQHKPFGLPGINLFFSLRGTSLTHGSPREFLRLLSRSALPPWITAESKSPSAWLAVPPALSRRCREATTRIRRS